MSELKEWALNYVKNGVAIIPLRPGTKAAARMGKALGGLHNPCRTVEEVESVWNGTEYGIGLPLGKINGVNVADIDYDDGCRKEILDLFPGTYVTVTGSGNHHAFFSYSEIKNATPIEKGLTIKSDGSYVVMPPTLHDKTGKPYLALHEIPFWKAKLTALPDWVVQAIPKKEAFVLPSTIESGVRDTTLVRARGVLARAGMNTQECFAALKEMNNRCMPPLSNEDLFRLARTGEHWKPDLAASETMEPDFDSDSILGLSAAEEALISTDKGGVLHTPDNVLRLLEAWEKTRGSIWYDEFHKKFFTTWMGSQTEWSDADTLHLMFLLQRHTGLIRVTLEQVDQAVNELLRRNTRNEPADWMKGLVWDQVPRIEGFFVTHCGAESSEYCLAASRNWWISMAARCLQPGCKVDNMVIWESGQGLLKSSALGAIGGSWYAESYGAVSEKDFTINGQGKLLIEISELDAFSRAEASTIKKVVSMSVDRFRPPYGKKAVDYPRTCIFVGTTNDAGYLKDVTGNRRFWPIRVRKIDLDRIKKDRAQLFAEAAERFTMGETWYEMPDSAADEQEDRMEAADPWTGPVAAFLAKQEELGLAADGVTVDQVFETLMIPIQNRLGWHGQRIGKILRAIGWERKRVIKGGQKVTLWLGHPGLPVDTHSERLNT